MVGSGFRYFAQVVWALKSGYQRENILDLIHNTCYFVWKKEGSPTTADASINTSVFVIRVDTFAHAQIPIFAFDHLHVDSIVTFSLDIHSIISMVYSLLTAVNSITKQTGVCTLRLTRTYMAGRSTVLEREGKRMLEERCSVLFLY